MSFLWSLFQAENNIKKKLYRYALSTVLQQLGKDVDIDPSTSFEAPEKIRINDGCKIGKGARLIGTSLESTSIDLGALVRIRPYVSLCAYGGKISLGRRVTIGEGSVICGHGGLTIGENTMISWLCSIVPANHIFDDIEVPLRLQGEERLGITIGSNAWIGSCVTILDGVNIGDNAIVGAGSVVTRDVPDWGVSMGIPARFIRDRRISHKRRPKTQTRIPIESAMTDVDDITEDIY